MGWIVFLRQRAPQDEKARCETNPQTTTIHTRA
jgi:hypothetical protein